MTENEILKIKEHIEIHARREHRAITITEILWKAVDKLEHIVDLEKENEQLKAKVSYLEDNLRVARKDRERLQEDVAKGIEEFVKEKPATSLHLLANKELREELEKLKQEFKKLKQEKINYIKILKDWENLVCVGLSEGCCPSCKECLFGELKEKTEKISNAKGLEENENN